MLYAVIEVYGKTFEGENLHGCKLERKMVSYLWKNFHNSMLVHLQCQLTWPFMGNNLWYSEQLQKFPL